MAGSQRKLDADLIEEFLNELAGQSWLTKSAQRRWWPHYVFHHTDVRNAAKILQDGRLVCRANLSAPSALPMDSGSVDVLDNTAPWVREWVRLYFRPRTPTQYRSEGIRPKDHIEMQAHCPVPVFFLFDSKDVLSLASTSFTNGNLAANTEQGSDATFLRGLDFQKIYHSGPHDRGDRSITFSRNAEVIVKGELGLSGLKEIVTRTVAERETLLSLLSPQARHTWFDRIQLANNRDLFDRRWTFIEHAELSERLATLYFSPDTRATGPFELKVTLREFGTNNVYVYNESGFSSRPKFSVRLSRNSPPIAYA